MLTVLVVLAVIRVLAVAPECRGIVRGSFGAAHLHWDSRQDALCIRRTRQGRAAFTGMTGVCSPETGTAVEPELLSEDKENPEASRE